MNNELEAQARQMRDAMVEEATHRADEWLRTTLIALGAVIPSQGAHASQTDARGREPAQRAPSLDLDENGALIDNIRSVVRFFGPRVFSTIDVLDAVSHIYDTKEPVKRSTISSTLKKLATVHGELQVVRQGKGSLPTKYRAVHPNSHGPGEKP